VALLVALSVTVPGTVSASERGPGDYPIVDTGQVLCYDDTDEIPPPSEGSPYHGQDAQYEGNQPSYVDNGDGTVTDLVTGLMWQQDHGVTYTFDEAVANAPSFELAGYDDWRLPTIKELYSLIDFSGIDPSGWSGNDPSELTPFIDTDFFGFEYGDPEARRIIDAQYWSSTEYDGTTIAGAETAFGVNFADGRIKGYPSEPIGPPGQQFEKESYVRHVRGNMSYGINSFVDNADGTITDTATGLTWMQDDSGVGYDWEDALEYAEGLSYAGHSDWRLPNAKELQSIVDYTRGPQSTGTASLDPLFSVTPITDEGGGTNYPFYWSSTTHANWQSPSGGWGAYVSFGEALGFMPPSGELMDVHGAGAQRSDPKSGDPTNWPEGHGPQGDVIRIYNYVRCVRDSGASGVDGESHSSASFRSSPNPFSDRTELSFVLPESGGNAVCVIYSPSGRTVRTLEEPPDDSGTVRFEWDGRSDSGRRVAAGVYFARLMTPASTERTRLVMLR
jgi:hypothetical protein